MTTNAEEDLVGRYACRGSTAGADDVDAACARDPRPCNVCGVPVCMMHSVQAGGACWSEHRCEPCNGVLGRRSLVAAREAA